MRWSSKCTNKILRKPMYCLCSVLDLEHPGAKALLADRRFHPKVWRLMTAFEDMQKTKNYCISLSLCHAVVWKKQLHPKNSKDHLPTEITMKPNLPALASPVDVPICGDFPSRYDDLWTVLWETELAQEWLSAGDGADGTVWSWNRFPEFATFFDRVFFCEASLAKPRFWNALKVLSLIDYCWVCRSETYFWRTCSEDEWTGLAQMIRLIPKRVDKAPTQKQMQSTLAWCKDIQKIQNIYQ